MASIRLYGCAIVLALWSPLAALGLRSDMFVGFMLGLVAVAYVIAARESGRRRQEGRR